MWCKECRRETQQTVCEICGKVTEEGIPVEIYRCSCCNIPIIRSANDIDRFTCPKCGGETVYMASDLRPVFPEERLLIEILLDKPLEYLNCSVWANANRYYIDDKVITISSKHYKKYTPDHLIEMLNKYKEQNSYSFFDRNISDFVSANRVRLNYIIDEGHTFIQEEASKYPRENIVISFSGGKVFCYRIIASVGCKYQYRLHYSSTCMRYEKICQILFE